MTDEKKTAAALSRDASKIKRVNQYRKTIPALLAVLALVLVIMYIASLLFVRNGSFTVSVMDYGDKRYSLTLCERPDFKKNTSKLTAKPVENASNISVDDLPKDLNDVDGQHSGENFLAYTFYLQNCGTEACTYQYKIVVSRSTLGIDAAARVRVYYTPRYYRAETDEYDFGGAYTDYAKPATGGNGRPEKDKYGNPLTNFASDSVIVEQTVSGFEPKDISKITVVIWLEGDDPDCNDDVMGGQFKADMSFEVIGGAEA